MISHHLGAFLGASSMGYDRMPQYFMHAWENYFHSLMKSRDRSAREGPMKLANLSEVAQLKVPTIRRFRGCRVTSIKMFLRIRSLWYDVVKEVAFEY